MSYIGNPPAERFTSFDYQDLTGGSGTSFTLTHPVGNAQEILVMVNNVVQEPGVAYTVSGTALTMTGYIVAADDFYVVYRGKAIQTATHPSDRALTATDGTFTGDLTVDTNTLHVDAANNRVGVGTAAPTELLHLNANNPEFAMQAASDGGECAIYFKDDDGNKDGRITYRTDYAGNPDNFMQFFTNGSERLRIQAGGGISFNGDTAAANALNDFETGTFTAVLDNVSVGYGSRSGRYTKIGNTVFVHLEITTTSLDTTDGSAYQIGGLPFTADGGGVLFSYDSENSTSLTQKSTRLGARMNNGLSSVRLSRDGSDYAYNNGTQSAGSIVCTLQYFTSQ